MPHGPHGARVCTRGMVDSDEFHESESPDPPGESMETAEGSPFGVCGKGMVTLNLSILVILLLGIGWTGSFTQGERSAARVHRGMGPSISLYPKKVPVPKNLPRIYVPPPPVQPLPPTPTAVAAEPSTTEASPPSTTEPSTTPAPPLTTAAVVTVAPAAAPAPNMQPPGGIHCTHCVINVKSSDSPSEPQNDSPEAKLQEKSQSPKEQPLSPTPYGWHNGYLAIYHKNQHFCAGVKAPAKNGKNVSLFPCDSEPSKLLQWEFTGKLQLKATRFCLDVTNHAFYKDTWLQIWECGADDVDQDLRRYQLESGAWRFRWLHGESHLGEGGPWYVDIKDQNNTLYGRPLQPHHFQANTGQFAN